MNVTRRLNEMRSDFTYQVGELVLKVDKSWVGSQKKLTPRYEGPYETRHIW